MGRHATFKDMAHGDAPSPLVNWLSQLDREAPTLPKAAGWFDYPVFLYARYPLLQPSRVPGDRYSKSQIKSGYETFQRELSSWERRISLHDEASRVVGGLTKTQRTQLAALVLDTVTMCEGYKPQKQSARRVHALARSAPRKERKLRRKVKTVHKALGDLRDYAQGLDPGLGRQHFLVAESALRILAGLGGANSAGFYKSIEAEYTTPDDPTTFGMVQLYWFFRHGCKLTGDESEVRVALIRNAFWKEYGVEEVAYRPKYKIGESQGCEAVRQAVRRFRSGRGTSS